MNPADGSSTAADHGLRDPDESERKIDGSGATTPAGQAGLQLADSVPYQQLSRSLLARAAELLVKAQQLEQPEPILPANKDRSGG